MSIGIITLNARFIHSSLSLRYLRNAARSAGHNNVWIREYVINQPLWKIAAEIHQRKPDVLGVSIYIWNRTQSLQLIELLKKQNPGLSIVIGGPEVSFETALSPDYTIISGEGEKKWVEYLDYRSRNEPPSQATLQQWNTYGTDLPDLVPAYIEEDNALLKNRMVYLETSRGCPYHCSFCLSALDKTVRYFDDKVIRNQITQLVNNKIRTIKFVDRTFNLQPRRMRDLMQWLTQFRETSFHFEVVGDILSEDFLSFLDTVPEGLFQFEIGIQTLTGGVQETIRRKQDNDKLLQSLARLVSRGKVHIHADLIFGLPGENLEQILDSFTRVFALKPHELQLGFLKFLPGAPIREVVESHAYQFQSFPPYEMVSNRDLSAGEVIHLKNFTEVFDLFYNSKRFEFSIDHLLRKWSPVDLFNRLLAFMEDQPHSELSLDSQYRFFADAFSLNDDALSMDFLKLDYLYHQKVYRLPPFMQSGKQFKTWQEDRKTPLIPFQHEIQMAGSRASLTSVSEPLHYVIVHPEDRYGYITRPAIKRVMV